MKFHISRDQKQVLKEILFVGGVIGIALIAPNAVQLLKSPGKNKPNQTSANRINYRRLLASLEHQGLVQIEADTVTLTIDGLGYTQILSVVDNYVAPIAHWDNKWRMVCFDIPESHKSARRFLRDNLRQLGFVHLQKSVYVFPYDCLSIVQQIADHFAISRFVTFGTIESLQNDQPLKLHFDLG